MASSLDRLQQNLDVEVTWHSFILRPPGSQVSPEHYARIEAGRSRFNEMAKRQYGLVINEGPFGINSIPALVGEKYAEAQGKGSEYHHIVQDAYWLEGQSIEDLNILRTLAVKAGLNGDEFITALSSTQYQEEVSNDVAFAHNNGMTGVPALVFNKKYLISGAQPYEALVDIVQQIEAGIADEDTSDDD